MRTIIRQRARLAVLILAISFNLSSFASGFPAPVGINGTYDLHLYFGNSAPFADEIQFSISETGEISGTMHVPNDFDAALDNIAVRGFNRFSFDVLVPKNGSRPVDLLFHYDVQTFEGLARPSVLNMVGLVSLFASDGKTLSSPSYVGSFVAFRKSP